MTTTTLIVEILISGILTCLWLLLGTMTAFGSGFLLGAVKDYPEAFAALAIAVAYAVGSHSTGCGTSTPAASRRESAGRVSPPMIS